MATKCSGIGRGGGCADRQSRRRRAGAIVGTLTINNNLTLQGNTSLRVNKTGGSPVQDNVTTSRNLGYGGNLTFTNITSDAPPLTLSDTFQLFSVTGSKTGNFTSIVGLPGVGLAFSFNPASVVLSLVIGVASNPTNITATVSGNVLTLTWPADHLGWLLQSQTNSLNVGLTTPANTWFDLAGSDSVTTKVVTMDPASPKVFYRPKKLQLKHSLHQSPPNFSASDRTWGAW